MGNPWLKKMNIQVGKLRKNSRTRNAVSAAMEPPREWPTNRSLYPSHSPPGPRSSVKSPFFLCPNRATSQSNITTKPHKILSARKVVSAFKVMFCPQFQSAEVDYNTLIINYFWVQMKLALVKNHNKIIMILSFWVGLTNRLASISLLDKTTGSLTWFVGFAHLGALCTRAWWPLSVKSKISYWWKYRDRPT